MNFCGMSNCFSMCAGWCHCISLELNGVEVSYVQIRSMQMVCIYLKGSNKICMYKL